MLTEPMTILLTGGTSGIGAALTRQLVDGGHRLVVLSRSAEKLEAMARQYPGLVTRPCDLAQRDEVEAAATELFAAHPEIRMVINNAGMQVEGWITATDYPIDSIEVEMATNFLGPVWLAAAALPHLRGRDQATAIVNVSSGLALYPKTGSAIYCASKAAG